ncbi:type IV secretory system conjugative DNA transfer family protein [uncultured Roseobacter sp.]|uniref:type IV secretory system conjugative DNA transfer family protein n=1 Tax=uncultured Roseobacter sp. TaxID=114847 RepID=UPI002616668A|nr:type IV secretory system conjugative DNA transfer family protein [uncultured Roseobacter sp.]
MRSSSDNYVYHDHVAINGVARFPLQRELRDRSFGPGGRLSFGFVRPDADGNRLQEISYSGPKPINLIAPNRTHKGTTLIRMALMHTSSLVAVDIRGEIALATYHYRKHVLGQDIVLFDPFDTVASALGVEADALNLADLVDPNSPVFMEEADVFTDGIWVTDANSQDNFWNLSGADALRTAIMASRADGHAQDGTIHDATRLFSLARPEFFDALDGIFVNECGEKTLQVPGMVDSTSRLVRDGARRLSGNDDKTLFNILATVRSQIGFLQSDAMQLALGKSKVDLSKLADGNTTLYIVIPSAYVRQYARLIRLIVTLCLFSVSKSQKFPDPPVLTLWDECAICGYSGQLVDSYGMQAGDGNQIVTVWQDINQLMRIYSDIWQTFIANAGMNIVFANNDLETQRYFSELSGTADIHLTTYEGARAKANRFSHEGFKHSADSVVSRNLITRERIKNMPPHEALFFPANMNPAFGFKAPYYLDSRFRDRRGHPIFGIPPRYQHLPAPAPIDFSGPVDRVAKALHDALKTT